MKHPLYLVVMFLCIIVTNLFSEDLVKKVLYKKKVYDFTKPVLINVVLKPTPMFTKITIFVNSHSITDFLKNINFQKETIESLMFYIEDYSIDNVLELFFEDPTGGVDSHISMLRFDQITVFKNSEIIVNKGKTFAIFVPTDGEGERARFLVDVSTHHVLELPDREFSGDNCFIMFKAEEKGRVVIKIFNESLMRDEGFLAKIVTVTVR